MLIDYLELLCQWMLLPLSVGLVAAGYREMNTITRRQYAVDPAIVLSHEFELLTTRGLNVWVLSETVCQVNQVILHVAGNDVALMAVAPDVDLAASYGHAGQPVFYQVRRETRGLHLVLWPIPAEQYALRVFAFATAAEVQVTQQQQPSAAFYQERHEKAVVLLKEWLTPTQQKSFARDNCFIVRGSKTKTRYRISSGSVFNVAQLNATGEPVHNLCFVPDTAPYCGDIMLAQKIMLETDEERALQIANRQPVTPAA